MTTNKVLVRCQWSSYMTGTVEESSLSGVHWNQYSSGVGTKSPRPFLHAVALCSMERLHIRACMEKGRIGLRCGLLRKTTQRMYSSV